MAKLVAVKGRDAGPWYFPLEFEDGTEGVDLTEDGVTFTFRAGRKQQSTFFAKAIEAVSSTEGKITLTAADVSTFAIGEWWYDLEIVTPDREIFVQDDLGATRWQLEVRDAFT